MFSSYKSILSVFNPSFYDLSTCFILPRFVFLFSLVILTYQNVFRPTESLTNVA